MITALDGRKKIYLNNIYPALKIPMYTAPISWEIEFKKYLKELTND